MTIKTVLNVLLNDGYVQMLFSRTPWSWTQVSHTSSFHERNFFFMSHPIWQPLENHLDSLQSSAGFTPIQFWISSQVVILYLMVLIISLFQLNKHNTLISKKFHFSITPSFAEDLANLFALELLHKLSLISGLIFFQAKQLVSLITYWTHRKSTLTLFFTLHMNLIGAGSY